MNLLPLRFIFKVVLELQEQYNNFLYVVEKQAIKISHLEKLKNTTVTLEQRIYTALTSEMS